MRSSEPLYTTQQTSFQVRAVVLESAVYSYLLNLNVNTHNVMYVSVLLVCRSSNGGGAKGAGSGRAAGSCVLPAESHRDLPGEVAASLHSNMHP